MSDLIKALQIFLKYGNKHNPTHCEHDVMIVGVDPELVSAEDILELSKLSFDAYYDDLDVFYSYRFGSC